jgi:hypothetical protein
MPVGGQSMKSSSGRLLGIALNGIRTRAASRDELEDRSIHDG